MTRQDENGVMVLMVTVTVDTQRKKRGYDRDSVQGGIRIR